MGTIVGEITSAAEFETLVASLPCTTAVFDCDGTLWAGDAGSEFMDWSVKTGLLGRKSAEWLDGRYRGYKRGEVSELSICGEMVQVYAGLREEEMLSAAREFFRTRKERDIFLELQRAVAGLQSQGVEIWAVSSTNDWVIKEGVKRFGINPDRVLAASVAVDAGVITGRLVDVPTDMGKVTALRRAGVAEPDAVFGNSIHDAAMLRMARRAFAINPTPALVERSATEGWAVYFPEAVRPI